jgi:nucleoid DNA-binding protein
MKSLSNKDYLIKKISKETDIPQNITKMVVKSFIDNLVLSLADGNSVKLKKLGTFHCKYISKKIMMNSFLKRVITTSPTYRVTFKSSANLKTLLKQKEDERQ